MTRWLHDLIAGAVILGTMLAAAAAVAAAAGVVGRAGTWPWYAWLVASPLLYLCWLVLFLLVSAWTCRQVGRRNPKPPHAVVHPGLQRGSKEILGMVTVAMCYRRLAILQTIPLVSLLSQFRRFDKLVLRSYSPSIHLGENVINWGGLYDPDLTEVGDNVVLGGQSAVAAHTMAIRGDGAMVYVSAPVRIGDRSTIGGEARVALGCVIGHDSILEPGAVLEPFTRIPPGEVWGGNPARYRRTRVDIQLARSTEQVAKSGDPTSPAETGPRPSAPARGEIRQLVIDALGLSPEQATGELSTDTCALWDSLGQMAIAAALFDRYGAAVDGAEIFRLKSLDHVAAVVAGRDRVEMAVSPDASAPNEAGAPERQMDSGPEAIALPEDLELLPLLDSQVATRALATGLDGAVGHCTRLRVHIIASFTAQPIEPALKLWGRAVGFDVECHFAGYDQVVQALLADGDPRVSEGDRVTVVLTRPEDFAAESASTALDHALDAVQQAASDRPLSSRLVVGTLPPVVSSFVPIDTQVAEALRNQWRSRLARTSGVELFDFSHVVERMGIEAARSSQFEVMARGGYSQRLHQELGIALIRHIRAARGPVAKVIALDCDNTLWGGVVGEVGLEGIELGPEGPGRSFQLFQQYLKRLKNRGLLLVVVSKNEENDVRTVFARHPEMVLAIDDIAAWRVNWRHKSENLWEVADELNLGLDSFVLLDDDPVARMEVKTRAPAVHVVPLPDEAARYCETLDRLWLFDGASATAVDASRTQLAHEEQHRREQRSSAASLEDFLASLELEVELSYAEDQDWPRIAQLTQRTNQFNLSLKRRTVDEVKALAAQSAVLVLKARDRFGDYGSVGVSVLHPSETPARWEIDTMLISCRALGRGVEDAFLHGIATAVAEAGGTMLVAPYLPAPRNQQVREFLAAAGFAEIRRNLWAISLEPLPPLPGHVRFRDPRAEAVSAGQQRVC